MFELPVARTHAGRTVKEAWESINSNFFLQLLESIKDRRQAVIDANGMHTRF